jgi:hypothetical protein
VIQIQSAEVNYTLNCGSISESSRLLLVYLTNNGLLYTKQLIFFAIGARSIHDEIMTTFKFARPKIILDWFHLEKKFAEGYGMAFKGKEIRNGYLGMVSLCFGRATWTGPSS